MAVVFHAHHLAEDRPVAIKLLPEQVSHDTDFARRFQREAHAMSQLDHPGIVGLYELGRTSADHLYFAMEYVDGATLHDVVQKIGLNQEQALSVAVQVCNALAYAHERGVIHRDVKPENILIDTESQVKIADFGLARLVDAAAHSHARTRPGLILGTPDYMAPEQRMGMNVDHRADIYSVGVLIYEMLCRRTPQGIFEPPSARTGCDKRIDRIVSKAMQQTPDRRYQSIQDMAADLQVVLSSRPEQPPAPKAVSLPSPTAPIYIGIAVAVAAIAAGLFFAHFAGPKSATPSSAAPLHFSGKSEPVVHLRSVDLPDAPSEEPPQ